MKQPRAPFDLRVTLLTVAVVMLMGVLLTYCRDHEGWKAHASGMLAGALIAWLTSYAQDRGYRRGLMLFSPRQLTAAEKAYALTLMDQP